MKKMKRISQLTAAVLTAVLLVSGLGAQDVLASDPLSNHMTNWPQMTDISCGSAAVMDASDGAILYSLDREVKRYPASITKILTCLLVIENCKMTDTVTIGQDAMDVAIAGNSNIVPVLGEQFTVEQCLYMLMLKSANDIAVSLADTVSGDTASFAELMNKRAAEMGCTGTHFTNPNGLPDENHYTTAGDMALIMSNCIQNETFRKIVSTTVYTVPATNKTATERTYQNHNKLIIKDSGFYYQYCIGGKTGYTNDALRTLVAAAEKDGKTLTAVTMYAPTNQDFTDIVSLLEYGFSNFSEQNVTVSVNGTETSGTVTLPSGITSDQLTAEKGTDGSGNTIYRYYYEKLPVGTGTEVKKAEPTSVPAASAADSANSSSSGTSGKSGKGISALRIILIILAVIVGAVLALMIFVLIRNARIRAARRRRRNRRGRR